LEAKKLTRGRQADAHTSPSGKEGRREVVRAFTRKGSGEETPGAAGESPLRKERPIEKELISGPET